MGLVDRAELLARTDLADLATQLCGPPVGHGRGAKWHCPNPDHPDRHPSMNIYPGRSGHPRWKCHACGEGGTAVDLVMTATGVNAGQAIRDLADRAGLAATRPPTIPASTRTPAAERPPAQAPDPAIERFVARTAGLLWQPAGEPGRQHLHERGFTEAVLHANRVGYDPGPARLRRPRGLPRQGPGIVYPILDPVGTAISYQLRYLDPDTAATRKYDQPVAELAPNPRFARIHSPRPAAPGVLVVCEGIPDALTAVHTGLAAVAVLGTGLAGTDTAATLASDLTTHHPANLYLIAFDNDPPGTTAATRLGAHLAGGHAVVARITPPVETPDLNAWWQADLADLTRLLGGTAQLLRTGRRETPGASL